MYKTSLLAFVVPRIAICEISLNLAPLNRCEMLDDRDKMPSVSIDARASTVAPVLDPEAERRVVGKIDRHLIPLIMFLCTSIALSRSSSRVTEINIFFFFFGFWQMSWRFWIVLISGIVASYLLLGGIFKN